MIPVIAIVALSVLALALLVALLHVNWANGRERQALLDRIEAPQASQVAATQRLIPRPDPKPTVPPPPVPLRDPDLLLLNNS